ncbi:MAG: SDR family oxidoreductase [Pseudonocardiaceae bacterium]
MVYNIDAPAPPAHGGPLAGQAAVVTGGSRGIGRAIVRRLAGDGATVVFTYNSHQAAAEQLVDEVGGAGGRAHAVALDLRDLARLEALSSTADEVFSRAGLAGLDILVNNAGVLATGSIAEVTEVDYDRIMATNAKGVFFAIQHAARRLRDGGRIINISTVSTIWPSPGEAIYAASKAALEQFTRVASRELGSRGITVNTVSPGPTGTDLLRGASSVDTLQGVATLTPLGRLGQPADIADLIALLVRADSRWVTGQNIRADGGLT